MTPPLSEAGLAALLGEHRPIMVRRIGGTADCSCGETLTTDDATILDFLVAHDAHLAAVLHAAITADREQAGRDALVAAAEDGEALADLIHPHMRGVRDRHDYMVGPAAQEAAEDVQDWLRQRPGEPT